MDLTQVCTVGHQSRDDCVAPIVFTRQDDPFAFGGVAIDRPLPAASACGHQMEGQITLARLRWTEEHIDLPPRDAVLPEPENRLDLNLARALCLKLLQLRLLAWWAIRLPLACGLYQFF